MLMQVRVAMATADVNIAVLTNQKAQRVPAMRNTSFVTTCIPVEVRQSSAIHGIGLVLSPVFVNHLSVA